MPFYEYECRNCGEQLETLQKISDPPLVDCPACSQPSLQKKISAAGFRLKGGGWYETDFKGGKQRNVAGGSESKSDGGGDKVATADKTGDKGAEKPAGTASAPAKTAGSGESASA